MLLYFFFLFNACSASDVWDKKGDPEKLAGEYVVLFFLFLFLYVICFYFLKMRETRFLSQNGLKSICSASVEQRAVSDDDDEKKMVLVEA